MQYKRKNPLRKRVTKSRAGLYAKKTPKVSLAVKKYIKKVIHTDQENKIINTNYSANFGTVLQSTNMNMYPMLPYVGYSTIPQGILQNNRIGNEVKVRKVMLKYVLRPVAYDSGINPFPAPAEVDMFLGYTKQSSGFLPGTVDIGYLFQQGSGSAAPSGNLGDLIQDVNTDYWTIKKRWRHKIGAAAYTGTGGNAANQYASNNDFKFNVVNKMDITKFCPKTLKFNDNTSSIQGRNLFLFYQAVSATGNILGASNRFISIDFWLDLTYEDA